MLQKIKQYFIYVFISYACLSSLFYFGGMLVGNNHYANLGFRAKELYLISPMPLLFDRKDFFNSSSVLFTFEDQSTELLNLDKTFMSSFPGSPHRQLHFLRLFAFAEFYHSPEWMAAMKYTLCNPKHIDLHLKTKDKVILQAEIKNHYKNEGGTDEVRPTTIYCAL